MPKPISELFLECYDAKVFDDPKNQNNLSSVFFRDSRYAKIEDRQTQFILGEKGSGKTIAAHYYSKVKQDFKATIVDFSSIDFVRFEKLFEQDVLKVTSLEDVWRLLLAPIMIQQMVRTENGIFSSGKFSHFEPLLAQIPTSSIRPEFPASFEILNKIGVEAKIPAPMLDALKIAIGTEKKENFTEIQFPLHELSRVIEANLSKVVTSNKYIVFVDGIDVKPDEVSQERFVVHLRAFVRAALALNDAMKRIKGGGYAKFVVLLRPDIFNLLGLQNQAGKVHDNSLVLQWNSSSSSYKKFDLYQMANSFLLSQNDPTEFTEDAWEYYVESTVYGGYSGEHENRSFLEFLRYSWFRPRDIIKLLEINKEFARPDEAVVTRKLFERARQNYSDYLLGEVRDFWRFYYSDSSFNGVLDFFQVLGESSDFTYDTYLKSFALFLEELDPSHNFPEELKHPNRFLQALYSANMICWRETNDFGKKNDYWSFRERKSTLTDPRIPPRRSYAVHFGLKRSLKVRSEQATSVD